MIVETIGYGDQLERTSLTVGLDPNDVKGIATATGAIMVFMRETGWEGGSKWVTTTMKKAQGGTTTKNGVTYEVIVMMPGMYNLSAGPARSKKPG